MELLAGISKCTKSVVLFCTGICYCDGIYPTATFVSALYELPSSTLQRIWFMKKNSYSRNARLSNAAVKEKAKHCFLEHC